ncbi:hypothetical protein [Shimia sagamensis]|uniref:Uncharacterized protein n=1 Tax=Shimia sagamensis TaxID=1566352 RepID=A0ABY1PG58_9RHOB|nr:hypothetical protein [Shimia sagamensis]SMP33135.1 hypothetical protein SAMN06265373_10917 [Shimia sagamensis]
MLKFVTELFKPNAPKAPPPITSETSMNFDAEEVAPFLTQLANNRRFAFPEDIAKAIGGAVSDIPVEDTKRWKITADFDGHPVRVEIEAFMDDVDAPDLYFFSTQAAISEIERELEAFAESIGT